MNETCCLCSQIAKDGEADLLADVLSQPAGVGRYVVREWPGFVLFPSIGALTVGHVILCPRLHVRSMSDLPNALEQSLSDVTRAVRELVSSNFGLPVHAFEHGNATAGQRVVCTVDHAHLHFIPADVSIERYLSRYQWTAAPLSLRDATKGREYLFYESPSGERLVTTGDGTLFPSQYLRRAFAEALGVGDSWNWRVEPAADLTRRTLSSFM